MKTLSCSLTALVLLCALGLTDRVHAAETPSKPAEAAAPTAVDLCGVPLARRKSAHSGSDEVDSVDKENIFISNCPNPPCRLRRKTTAYLSMKFKPEKDVKTLKTEVNARILGVPFPFLGVDNTNACNNVFLPNGEKARCPLKAGEDYVYKNQFDILEIYPKVKIVVHWALVSQDNERILCFDVPARITS